MRLAPFGRLQMCNGVRKKRRESLRFGLAQVLHCMGALGPRGPASLTTEYGLRGFPGSRARETEKAK